ncbi:hypothetical protein EMWEY_00014970 [Eimeria maxima]|uniref:Uncharacterized protein n=1 Tax=Eimeria maxima TaxID=5804 RepID=U6M239_EIMMA|nr:hypothetical protein EMWEY_00014970 [Eimeria maxima]CDJ58307.1 hypothetical protein EMWEY_00014970 [Eimeria maxima]
MPERPNILQENSRPCASPAFAISELPAAGPTSPRLGHLRARGCRSSSCLITLLAAFASVAAVAVLISLCSRAFEKRALHGLRTRRLSNSAGHDTSIVHCSDTEEEDDEKEYQSLHLLNFSPSTDLELPLKKKLLARVAATGPSYNGSRTQQLEQQEYLQGRTAPLDLSTRTGEVGPWPFAADRPVSSTGDQLLGDLDVPAALSNIPPHQQAAGHWASYRAHGKPLDSLGLRRWMSHRWIHLQGEERRQQQLQLHLQRQHDLNELYQQQRLLHWQPLLWQQQEQQMLQSQGQYFMHHLGQRQHHGEYTAPPCHWHPTQVGQRTEELGRSLPQNLSPLPSPQLQTTTQRGSPWGLMNIRAPKHATTNFASGARRKSPAKLRKLQQQIWQMQLQMRQMQRQIVWLQRRLQRRLRPGQPQKSHGQLRHLPQQRRQQSRRETAAAVAQRERPQLLHGRHQQHMKEYQKEQRLLQQQEQQEVSKDHQQQAEQVGEQAARRRKSEQQNDQEVLEEERRQLLEPTDSRARYLSEDAWISSGSSMPESPQSSTTQEALRSYAVDTAAGTWKPGFSRVHAVLGVPRHDASTEITSVASGDEAVATGAAGAVTANTAPTTEVLYASASSIASAISGDGLSFNVSIASRPRDNDSTQAAGAAEAEAAAGSTTPTYVSSLEVTELASVPASSRPARIEHPFVRLPKMLDNAAAPLVDLGRAVATRPGRRDVGRLLQAAHDLLVLPYLGGRHLNDLVHVVEELIENAVNHQRQDVSRLKTSRAVERLATRFLLMDAVVSAFLVLGQQVNSGHWKILTEAISHASPPVSKFGLRVGRQSFNSYLCQKLSKAIVTLKTGARPHPVDLLDIKRMLFCSPLSPQRFKTPEFDSWRKDDGRFGGQ